MCRRCYLTSKRKRAAEAVEATREQAVVEARLVAVAQARAEGNHARADVIQAIIDREAAAKPTGKQAPSVHRAGNLLDRYTTREDTAGGDEEAGGDGGWLGGNRGAVSGTEASLDHREGL
jgi:hypothetical protein